MTNPTKEKRVWLALKGNEKSLRLSEAEGWEVHEVAKAAAPNSPEDIRQSMDLLQQIHRESLSSNQRVAQEFSERLDRAHGQSRPLIIDWEFACKVRDALSGSSPTGELADTTEQSAGLASQIQVARKRIASWPADVRAAMGLPVETTAPRIDFRQSRCMDICAELRRYFESGTLDTVSDLYLLLQEVETMRPEEPVERMSDADAREVKEAVAAGRITFPPEIASENGDGV